MPGGQLVYGAGKGTTKSVSGENRGQTKKSKPDNHSRLSGRLRFIKV
ncbi:hypothetical protein FUAX_08080 [Fulvitalea axinellae]|uniref:Uncharacterized protein n=1 Tax=Fulvitalea axinellae TaxID=1182444 RepID=A0AAU9C8D3_9BACT|nr:hypothetical protein FUAX_08080 [Fulvitalea axinellae]